MHRAATLAAASRPGSSETKDSMDPDVEMRGGLGPPFRRMIIEAFILAGGRSSRFGRDKALERAGGTTLAERAFAAVRRSGVASATTFVIGSNVEFAKEARRLGAPFVSDISQGRGPLGGLQTALVAAKADWIFLFACDLPLISPEFIRFLGRQVSEAWDVVVPRQPDGRLQPLCAFYRREAAAPAVDAGLASAEKRGASMLDVIEMLRSRIVEPSEYGGLAAASAFANINTAADLASLEDILTKV
jgi:molybdenum cofactor guanylyltransferase